MTFFRNYMMACVLMISLSSRAEEIPEFRSIDAIRSYRAKVFTAFHVAQYKLYVNEGKGTPSEVAAYQAVVVDVIALQRKVSSLSLRKDLGKDQEACDSWFGRYMSQITSAKIKSEPPFARSDINAAAKLMGDIECLLILPLP